MVDSPLPLSYTCLSLALPGIYLAGRWVARRTTGDRDLAKWLAPGLAFAMWLLAVHATGLVAASFRTGLLVATIALAAAGGALAAWDWQGKVTPPADAVAEPSRWILPVAALACAALAPLAFGWAFHDELPITGHMSIPAQLLNDVYPPRHLNFPDHELRYHYGFDLGVALIAALFRAPVPVAIDLLTLAGWGYSWGLVWLLGDRLFAPRRGPLASLITHLGGGIPFFCAGLGAPAWRWLMGVRPESALNPTILSYFFQHPWALGFPVGACVLLVLWDSSSRGELRRLLVIGGLLTCLSLCEFVLFLCLLGAIVVAAWASQGRLTARRGLATLGMALAVLIAARSLHGFFLPAPDPLGRELELHIGIAEGLVPTLSWHLQTFGLLLPLGLYGLHRMPRGRLLVAALIGGSLLVINLVRYSHSWDIAKFATVTSWALSLPAAATIGQLWARSRPAAVAASILTLAASFTFLLALHLHLPGILFSRRPPEVGPDDARAIAWLRRHVRPTDVVFRPEIEQQYALWGGLAVSSVEGAAAYGFSSDRLAGRYMVVTQAPPESSSYRRESIRWFVLGEKPSPFDGLTARWIAGGEAHERARFGALRVVELDDAPPP